jgi:hypothetical protein
LCDTEPTTLRIATSILIVLFALQPASAAAQERAGLMLPTARQLARALDAETIPARARFAQAQPVRNDSLKNGALIGAIIGAAALGAFAWFLVSTDEACGCKADILRGAALGAGIGAGIGVGVDALLDRRSLPALHPGLRLAFTF